MSLFLILVELLTQELAVPWLRQLVADLLLRRPGFVAWVSLCGIYDGQSHTGRGFSPSSSVYLSTVTLLIMYHVGDEQQANLWLQFRHVVSPH